jgi:saccharopine dehydrogenase-like NADP-dependent oxidoreductase
LLQEAIVKALVFGMGLQGKAVVHDLEGSDIVTAVTVAELDVRGAEAWLARRGCRKTRVVALDAEAPGAVGRLVQAEQPQVVVSMLPPPFQPVLARAAVDAGVPYASSSYAGALTELDAAARERGVALLPEMGMDPGIDLVLGRLAVDELDVVHGMRSYGAGLPEPACAGDNPIGYKITWTFEGVLKAYMRPARLLKDGREVSVPAGRIFQPENGHRFEVPGVGTMDAYPNGDALHYIELFGLGPELREMGRYAMRWPGHNRFWDVMAELGFLDEAPERIGSVEISPRRFVVEHLAPRLQFREGERDMVVIRVEAWGLKGGRPRRVTYELVDYRDLATGLFAMNRTVGFTTSIAAQMLLAGRIRKTGLLSPVRDVPASEVLAELERRGMSVQRRVA